MKWSTSPKEYKLLKLTVKIQITSYVKGIMLGLHIMLSKHQPLFLSRWWHRETQLTSSHKHIRITSELTIEQPVL